MLQRSDLHHYQENGITKIFGNTHLGLLLEMGLGKTATSLTAFSDLKYKQLDISSALVVAPKRVVESVWVQEAANWEHLQHLKIVRVTGNVKQRLKAIQTPADIHIISRDNIVWLCQQFERLPWEMLIVDESSSFKNPSSMRFKSLKQRLDGFERVVILTGTPAPNGLVDIWSQIFLLDKGKRLGKTITGFKETFFSQIRRPGTVFAKLHIKDESVNEIHRRISDICVSMKARDYLELPPRIDNVISIDMPADIRKQYREFEERLVLELNDKEITAVNAASLANKLLQFCNGAVYDENRGVNHIHDLKLEALDEIIEAAQGAPVLVAWTFQHDRDRIMQHFKKLNPVQLKSEEHVKQWNNKQIQLMLMHPASGGHGLNLQRGGNIIAWFGNTWSLELEQQFNARLDRQGQKQSVTVNKLALAGSMDYEVINAQVRKAEGQSGLMDAVKAIIQKYK